MKPFRVSADYIEWAHSSAAEDGHDLAIELCELPVHPAASPYVLVADPRLVFEIADVAELYVGGERGDNDRRAARVRARALRWLADSRKEQQS